MRPDRHWRESLALFVMCAWPTWVVTVPPLQDLPNHLATAFVQSHLDRYPELVSNGFLKTNSTLFVFLHVASRFVSLRLAAKMFVTLTCAVGAFAYPRAVRELGGRVHSASFLLWPLVHNWFVATGMLDYALSIPLVLLALVELRRRPILGAALALAVWYTHAFGVVMLALLVAIEIVWTRKWKDVIALGAPLVPALALFATSAVAQLDREAVAGPAIYFEGAGALAYGAWAESLWSLTKWTLASFVAAGALAIFGVWRFRESPKFFSPLALGALIVLYVGLPYQWHHWYFFCSRVLPFFWFGCALRVPELGVAAKRAFAACGALYSAGLGVEYVQIAHDWNDVARGEVAVPAGSRLLPLFFDHKGPHGDNTWPMVHTWGLYVIDLGTSAPLVFAHSRSFPLTYAVAPPPELHGITLERFPYTGRTPAEFCAANKITGDCTRAYDDAWRQFWSVAAPRFDRVLAYGVTPDARARFPKTFRTLYENGETLVLATGDAK